MNINIDAIGDKIDTLISKKLEDKGYPNCLGKMCPPIIECDISIPDKEIVKVKNSISKEEVIEADLLNLMTSKTAIDYKNFTLSRGGIEQINKYKDDISSIYVEAVIKCTSCKFREVCDQLTKNYLMTLYLRTGG